MYKLLVLVFSILTLTLFSSLPVFADSSSEISFGDAASVPETVDRITAALENQGYEIVLVVNHSAAAASVGLELAPTQVIFARQPRSPERKLLGRSQTVGIDLPVKVLVFENNGVVQVNSNSVGYLIDRHDIRLHDQLLSRLDYSLEQFESVKTGLVTVKSLQSMDDTVASLKAAIMANPAFRIPLVLDYDVAGRRNHSHPNRRSQVLIVFGNPNAGTPLMQVDQKIGIDLPQKFLVWEDREGKVNITYNDPHFIAERHGVQGVDTLLETIAGALQRFAFIGAGRGNN